MRARYDRGIASYYTRSVVGHAMEHSGGTDDSRDSVFKIEEVDESAIIEAVVDYIRINDDSGRIVLASDFDTLDKRQKSIAILLAQRLLSLRNSGENPLLSPEEIGKITESGVTELYPAIRKLEQEKIISNQNGKYLIPPEKINAAKSIL